MAHNVVNDAPERGTQADLVTQLNALMADVDALRTKYNGHTHNSTVAALSAGEQQGVLTADKIVLVR